jgi:predicted DNA-binding protein (MmcQ/YjbR family)
MHLDELREYCLAKQATTEVLPFGPDTLVFKVAGKIFALTGLDETDLRVNLKCDPDYAIELRERHEEIKPGWHMNKVHWNTVYIEDGDLNDRLIRELVDHSYDIVVKKLSKKGKLEFGFDVSS